MKLSIEQDIGNNDSLMGGIRVFVTGDFRQIHPVNPKCTGADEIRASLKSSMLWRHVQIVTLTTNMREYLYAGITSNQFARK